MTSEQFDAVIVGAGFGGIGAAIQLKRMGIENFVILDREEDLGGTWHVNRYPGLAVDVPTTTYSYFFEPNPNWSRLFSTGSEIKQYADDVADKYDVRTHMRFNTTVEGARWDDEAKLWRVALAGGETLTTRYLITATGFLSQPKTPDIPGIDELRRARSSTPPPGTISIRSRAAGSPSSAPAPPRSSSSRSSPRRSPTSPSTSAPRSGWCPRSTCASAERAKRLFARVPLTQRAIRWLTDSHLRVHDQHRDDPPPQVPPRSTSPRPTCRRFTASPRFATRSCAAS